MKLSFNKIQGIRTGTFQRLSNLEILSLDQNEITKISSEWFSLNTKLNTLDMTNNQITEALTPAEGQFLSLEIMRFENNSIEILDQINFRGMKQLQ